MRSLVWSDAEQPRGAQQQPGAGEACIATARRAAEGTGTASCRGHGVLAATGGWVRRCGGQRDVARHELGHEVGTEPWPQVLEGRPSLLRRGLVARESL